MPSDTHYATCRRYGWCPLVIAENWEKTGAWPAQGSPYARSRRWSSINVMSALVRIAAVRVLHDRIVELTLTDGRACVINLAPLLVGSAFSRIREDAALFAQVDVDPEFGGLVWPSGEDICPDVLIWNRVPTER